MLSTAEKNLYASSDLGDFFWKHTKILKLEYNTDEAHKRCLLYVNIKQKCRDMSVHLMTNSV